MRSRFRIRLVIVGLAAVAAVVAAGCEKRMTNRGGGMAPAIEDGEQVVVTMLNGAPLRGDIVVFKYPVDPTKMFVKRVIGLPGERIESRDGQIFINGQPLAESYVRDDYKSHDTWREKTVPDGAYFVIGDHRNNSSDSRAWGTVASDLITGQVKGR